MLLPSSLRLAVSCWGSMPDIREPGMRALLATAKTRNRNEITHRPTLTGGYRVRATSLHD